MSAVYTLGIDVGSTASKCIILKDGKEIVAKSLIDVGAGTSGPQRAIDAVLDPLKAAGYSRQTGFQSVLLLYISPLYT